MSPCQNCKCRKPICHDRCGEYLAWHDELVAAKKELREARKAIDIMLSSCKRAIGRRNLR